MASRRKRKGAPSSKEVPEGSWASPIEAPQILDEWIGRYGSGRVDQLVQTLAATHEQTDATSARLADPACVALNALSPLEPGGVLLVVAALWRRRLEATPVESDAAVSLIVEALAGLYLLGMTEEEAVAALEVPRRWARARVTDAAHPGRAAAHRGATLLKLLDRVLTHDFPSPVAPKDRDLLQHFVEGPIYRAFPEHAVLAERIRARGSEYLVLRALDDLHDRLGKPSGRGVGGLKGVTDRTAILLRTLRSLLVACGMDAGEADDVTTM